MQIQIKNFINYLHYYKHLMVKLPLTNLLSAHGELGATLFISIFVNNQLTKLFNCLQQAHCEQITSLG